MKTYLIRIYTKYFLFCFDYKRIMSKFVANFVFMSIINVKDKQFATFLREDEILKEIHRVASDINNDMKGTDNVLFLCMLNGAFMFASDLMKKIDFPCEISFVKFSSYSGTSSTGKVKEVVGLNTSIKGRTVIIVEDIVESGLTMKALLENLRNKGAKELRVATMLLKPNKLEVDLKLDYVGFNIPDDFIVGYGLDYDGFGRNLSDIYTLVE